MLLAGGSRGWRSVVAQMDGRSAPRERRVFMLDGRGGQIGVSVDDLDEQGLKAAAGAPSGVRIAEVDSGQPGVQGRPA